MTVGNLQLIGLGLIKLCQTRWLHHKSYLVENAKEEDFQKLTDTTDEIEKVLGKGDGTGTGLYEMKRMIFEDFKSPAAVSRIQGILASAGAIFWRSCGSGYYHRFE